MLGPALLVTPVLEQGRTNVTGLFVTGKWFEFATGALLQVLNSACTEP
jgi:alpha-glucosidase (family GH31 glycosyl hydrolase)